MLKQTGSKKITVRFSSKLKSEMHKDIIRLGYGLHGKSRWITEAIEYFLIRADYLEVVDNGLDINQGDLNFVEAFYLPLNTTALLRKAILEIRNKFPLFEGVQSSIIRASAINRLLGIKFPRGEFNVTY